MEERRIEASASFVAAYILHLSQLEGSDHRRSSAWALAFKAVMVRKELMARRSRSQLDCFELLASMAIKENVIAYLLD